MRLRRPGLILTIFSVAALSVAVIACRTGGYSYSDARTVELRQVQRVALAFNNGIDRAIAGRAGLGDDYVDICPPQSRAYKSIYDQFVWHVKFVPQSANRGDIPVDFTVVQLQEMRALFNLKVDEAFLSHDGTAYRELLNTKIANDGMTGTVTAPTKASVTISELR